MFQKMSQATLLIILLNGTDTLSDIEFCTLLGPCIVTDIIRQTVVQLSNLHIGVNGNRWHLLRHRGCRCCYQQQRSNK